MRDYLIINGRNLKEFGIYAFGNSIHDFPERVVEKISVPGRTGDLFIDKGKWENIDVEYSVVLLDGANLDRLKAFLMTLNGYVRIESTFEPDYYRMGRFLSASSPKVHKEAATVTLTFDCKPQKWLKSGEVSNWSNSILVTEESPVTIYNPTAYPAWPYLMILPERPSGTITFTNYLVCVNTYGQPYTKDIGHSIITAKREQHGNWYYIDCETKTAFWYGNNLTSLITVEGGDFPQIMPKRYGNEPVDIEGEVYTVIDSYTVVEMDNMSSFVHVAPRWWTL